MRGCTRGAVTVVLVTDHTTTDGASMAPHAADAGTMFDYIFSRLTEA